MWNREEEIVVEKEVVLYKYESGRIPGTNHKS